MARPAPTRSGAPARQPPRLSTPRLSTPRLSTEDYQTLSRFRYLLRRFLEYSQSAAVEAGLTPRQHQALLAIKGFPRGGDVGIHDLAERLRIRHHSAVELVDRLEEAGLVVRKQDPVDRRRVLLRLTPAAERRLASLSAIHLEELRRMRPALLAILKAADGARE